MDKPQKAKKLINELIEKGSKIINFNRFSPSLKEIKNLFERIHELDTDKEEEFPALQYLSMDKHVDSDKFYYFLESLKQTALIQEKCDHEHMAKLKMFLNDLEKLLGDMINNISKNKELHKEYYIELQKKLIMTRKTRLFFKLLRSDIKTPRKRITNLQTKRIYEDIFEKEIRTINKDNIELTINEFHELILEIQTNIKSKDTPKKIKDMIIKEQVPRYLDEVTKSIIKLKNATELMKEKYQKEYLKERIELLELFKEKAKEMKEGKWN